MKKLYSHVCSPCLFEDIVQPRLRLLNRDRCPYGDFYRLLSPYNGNDTAWITVSKDKTEAMFMLTRTLGLAETMSPIVRLRGLDKKKIYTVGETGERYSGAELMSLGIAVPLPKGDVASVSWVLCADA